MTHLISRTSSGPLVIFSTLVTKLLSVVLTRVNISGEFIAVDLQCLPMHPREGLGDNIGRK